tara:strand:+ start:1623 stop:2240 length:618 start_codon:yes stop_codon:yes gene_type:complete
MLFTLIFWLISAAYGEDKPNHEIVVRPSNVKIYVGNDPTSEKLSNLVSTYASLHKENIRHTITKSLAPDIYEGKIRIYDETNIKILNKTKCDYKTNAIVCGMENKHWTIVPSITVEQLHANFNLSLFDESGEMIASSSVPVWGFIQLLPRFKRTTITENGIYGKRQREIVEQYPPKRKEIPPLVTSAHVSQAIMLLYLSIEVENI